MSRKLLQVTPVLILVGNLNLLRGILLLQLLVVALFINLGLSEFEDILEVFEILFQDRVGIRRGIFLGVMAMLVRRLVVDYLSWLMVVLYCLIMI